MKFRFTIYSLLFTACAFGQLQQGIWRMELKLNDSTQMPFRFEVIDKSIEIINAEERIKVDEITFVGDSVFIKMPLFDSEFRMELNSKHNYMKGYFLNHARLDKNIIPAAGGVKTSAFEMPADPVFNISGRWEVHFEGDDPPLDLSIGEFKQHGRELTGTFLTSTGDYRYLEGMATKNWFEMSAFDGSHLFYFTGRYEDDGSISGHYYSGMHWHDTWLAQRNEEAQLPNPDSLTFLKPGFSKLDFTFPDADSNMISISDKKFQNKVVIVQIMGTWCPNCMDETQFLSPFYSANKMKGLEVIGLDYERIATLETAKKNLARLKKKYAIDYTLLYAGTTDKTARAKTLPMLSDILSFPTTIFIDKKGRVRKIHTGFSGPATGAHYEKWKDDFTSYVAKLLNE